MSFEDKTIIFLGSSVTCGDSGWSMCEHVREVFGCNTVKWAVSGTTLADVDESSYVSRLRREIVNQQNCDCFICQLSTNDAWRNIPLGEISLVTEKDLFDTKTTAGAIEYIISLVKEKWNCPIIFYTGTYFESERYQKMVDMLLEINKKWGLGVIDLWNDTQMRNVSEQEYKKYMRDSVHPTDYGYKEWWGPKFVDCLEKVFT